MLFSSALTGIIIPFILIHTLKEKRALVAVTIIPVNTIIKTNRELFLYFNPSLTQSINMHQKPLIGEKKHQPFDFFSVAYTFFTKIDFNFIGPMPLILQSIS